VQIRVTRIFRIFSVISIVAAGSLVAPAFFGTPASATGTTVTQTFGFDSDALQNFTVPPDVTSLTITATGGQGGWGGADSAGNPPAGGYQGQVSGTISVTPGDYLTIGVGAGADEPYDTACTGGRDEQSPADAYDAAAGVNPLSQYDGGMGGAPGYNGCSGYGGAGGAATAVEVGSSASAPTSVGTIVAGGGGGDGGSGQYVLVRGQIGLASYVPPTTPTSITYGIPAGCTTAC
jgi:titin